jgi:6-phosphogluconolactonase
MMHGGLRGLVLALARIGRCVGGWFTGGDDPVPERFGIRAIADGYRRFRSPRRPRVVYVPERDAGRVAAAAIRDLAKESVARRGRAVMGFPGGRSVEALFPALAGMDLPWDRIHWFQVDERCVPPDHPDANIAVAQRLLFEPLRERGESAHVRLYPFAHDPGAADSGAGAYDRLFGSLGGRFDVLLLGLGDDGHVASLFPGAFHETTPGILYQPVTDAPKPPPRRVSVAPLAIVSARVVVLLAFGESKRSALARALDPSKSEFDCPARYALRAGRCVIYAGFPASERP